MEAIARLSRCAYAYQAAKEIVELQGYASEISWQRGQIGKTLTESEFLKQAAWVVLSAGMRESIVRKVFGEVSEAFHHWQSAQAIVGSCDECVEKAKKAFNHDRKIKAIANIASIIDQNGFDSVSEQLSNQGAAFLQQFPYIGPITCNHLAKNLGINVAKADRHLMRVCAVTGYGTPKEMCEEIARVVGDEVAVVDLVIWRFATIEPQYTEMFADPIQFRNSRLLNAAHSRI